MWLEAALTAHVGPLRPTSTTLSTTPMVRAASHILLLQLTNRGNPIRI